ncbi:MAG: site-specific integrase, partial [Candidatus Sulfotelmatobacter sp.]
IRSLASGIFTHAVNVGAIESNPWHDVKVLGKTKEPGETKHYTLEEIENIITALVNHVECQLIMALAFFLGLRKGEVQGLKWEDFDKDSVHIRRAVARGVVGTPKTKKSIRTLPLIAPVRIPLMLWRKKSGSPVDGWVFPHKTNGKSIEIRTLIRCVIVPTLIKQKIEWKGIQAGRRGTGTILRKLTGNSTAGRDVLGHEDESTTKEHYEGALPEEALQAMKLLEAAATKG